MPAFARIFTNSIGQAFSELRANKLRSALSLLGITIGIFCIVAVLTVLESMQNNIRKEVASLGSDVLYVGRWPWTDDNGVYKWWEFMNRPSMTMAEFRAVKEGTSSVAAVALVFGSSISSLHRGAEQVEGGAAYGVTAGFDQLQSIEVAQGRYLTTSEIDGGVSAMVIGRKIYEALFPGNTAAIDEVLPFNGKRYHIVGVLKKEGQNAAGFDFDNAVIYPYLSTTLDVRSLNYDPLLIIKARENASVADMEIEVSGALRRARKVPPGQPDNFSINQLKQISEKLNSLFGVINGVGWLIGGFSLIVGLFGIANIMFVTVKERTRFIGLKKAVGAQSIEILTEFLTEAVVLCLLGGIAGLLLVWVLALVMTKVADFPVALSLRNIFIGFGVSTLVGLLAGFVPARRAARMNPVVAIRSN